MKRAPASFVGGIGVAAFGEELLYSYGVAVDSGVYQVITTSAIHSHFVE